MIALNEKIILFPGAVNLLFVRGENAGILIDGGLEDGRMKKVVRELTAKGLRITHLLITHAHADHYGGVAWLQQQQEVRTYAPAIEAQVMQSSILEPIALFSGAFPLAELRNKFLEAPSIRVDELLEEGQLTIDTLSFQIYSLPGHSYNQVGIGIEDYLFYGADCYLPVPILEKYGLPFIVDAEASLSSLDKVSQLSYPYYICGHGEVEESVQDTLLQNRRRHEQVLQDVLDYILSHPKATVDQVMSHILDCYSCEAKQLSAWLLYRTTILAYIQTLLTRQEIQYRIEQHQLVFIGAPQDTA